MAAEPPPGGPPEARDAVLDRFAVSDGLEKEEDVGLSKCRGAEDDCDSWLAFLDDVMPVGSGDERASADGDLPLMQPLLKSSEEGRRLEKVRWLDRLIAEGTARWGEIFRGLDEEDERLPEGRRREEARRRKLHQEYLAERSA